MEQFKAEFDASVVSREAGEIVHAFIYYIN